MIDFMLNTVQIQEMELRTNCLEMAITFVNVNPQKNETVRQTAEKFYNFIVNGKVEDDVK